MSVISHSINCRPAPARTAAKAAPTCKRWLAVWLLALSPLVQVPLALAAELSGEHQSKVIGLVTKQQAAAETLAQTVGTLAELGYQEVRSARALTDYLQAGGFTVESAVADIPTAFVASVGSGKPVIGILAEFDALPGLSQAPVAKRQPIEGAAAGHACGHHLFGAASATAGRALAQWLRDTGQPGTIKVFGTPAEEGGSGKVYLARAGVFADVDVMLHWHPGDGNDASAASTTANKSGRFTFHGTPSHAAQSPERGRSALDAVEAMNYMVNLMREHVPSESRIHYVITDGGAAPNIVPERAQVYYYVRHPNRDRTASLFDRVVRVAEAAAAGTETTMDVEVMHGNYPVLPNETLARVVYDYLSASGGVRYSADERKFAEQIRETFTAKVPPLTAATRIAPFQTLQRWGSTDVGDVSWQVPTVGFAAATWVPGTAAHTWQAVAAGGMSIGNKGMLLAARTLALTGARLLQDPELIGRARQEFDQRRGPEFRYAALLGDRKPPLDYRK
ncbi:MAG: amidohydrolase [Pseudomonadales bacterium]